VAVYAVFFELTSGVGLEVREVFGDVPAILASLGPTVQVSSSACLLACELRAYQIMEHLWQQVLGLQERILILPIEQGVAWRLHSSDTDDVVIKWLGQFLPSSA